MAGSFLGLVDGLTRRKRPHDRSTRVAIAYAPKPMRLAVALAAALALALAAPAAHALKPCAPNPCRPSETFDETACRAAAKWVATGRIAITERRPFEAEGVEMELGSFELTVDAWEKGTGPAKVAFVTTWCWNDVRLLAGDGKRFRIYGADDVVTDAGVIRIRQAVPLDAIADPATSTPKPKVVEPRIEDQGARRGRCGCEAPGARANDGWLVGLGALLTLSTRRLRRSPRGSRRRASTARRRRS